MIRPACLRTIKGLSVAVIATVGLLLLPVAATWGSKARVPSGFQAKLDQLEDRKTRQLPRVTAVERPADLSPFGASFEPDRREMSPEARRNLVETAIGWVDLRRADEGILSQVPASLRAEAAGQRAAGNKGRGLSHGLNLVQIDAEALRTQGYDSIEAEIRQHGRILDQVPERALVVRVANERDFDALAALPFVEAIGAYEPAYKVSPLTGRLPLMQTSRAHARDLDLIVALWHDTDAGQGRSAIEAIAGRDKVSPWSIDGSVLQVMGSSAPSSC
jgi:hypothetical protein